MAKKPINYNEPEIPAEFTLKYAIKHADEKLKHEHIVWRIFLLDPSDGSVTFAGNNTSLDWKSERNAKEKAEWINQNKRWWHLPPDGVAIARKCKVTVEEL